MPQQDSMQGHSIILRATGPRPHLTALTSHSKFDLILQGRCGYLRGIWRVNDALTCAEQALLAISAAHIPVTIQAEGLSITGFGLAGAAEGLHAAIMAALDAEGASPDPARRSQAFDLHPWARLHEALLDTLSEDGKHFVRILAVAGRQHITLPEQAEIWLVHDGADRVANYRSLDDLCACLSGRDFTGRDIRLVTNGLIVDAAGPAGFAQALEDETGTRLRPLCEALALHPAL